MLLDNAVDLGQPQPGPPTELFGGKEGLKDVRQHVGRYPRPAIRHRQSHPPFPPRFDPAAGHAADLLGRTRPGEGEKQLAALWHRVPRVERQVHDDLLHAGQVGLDRVLVLPVRKLEPDRLRQGALQQFDLFFHQRGQVQRSLFQH